MIYDGAWMARVKLVNEMPINKAAIEFLPGKKLLETELAVLDADQLGAGQRD